MMKTSSLDEAAVTRRRGFRDVMGCFATGVTVVTWPSEDLPRGLTANAVSSLSLDPLLLLFCVDRGSRANLQLEAASGFAINILSHDQEHVSRAFARYGSEGVANVPFRPGSTGSALLDGSVAWLECTVTERLRGGDHVIYVGAVEDFEVEHLGSSPLLYFKGHYRQLDGDR